MNTSTFSAERSTRLLPAEEFRLSLRRSYFSELIQTLFLRDNQPECRPIMFASPDEGAGVSFISSYVATELEALGGRVLLADAQALVDLARRPAHDLVKLTERVDLSRLWVLGLKQASMRSPEDRGSVSSVISVVTALRDEFSYIVIDAPALSTSADAITLATAVYGTVFVAQAGRTAMQELVRARQKFTSLGGRVLGSVYNAKSTAFDQGERV